VPYSTLASLAPTLLMSLAPSGSKDVVGGQALHERVTLPTLLRLLRLPAG
jgi:hypothetical protein